MWELLGVLVILASLAIPILAIVAFVRTSRLTKRLTELEVALSRALKDLNESSIRRAASEPDKGTIAAERTPDDKVTEDALEENAPAEDPPDEPAAQEAEPFSPPTDEKETGDEDADQPAIAASTSPWPVNKKQSTSFDFESLVGGRWAVLLGGFALALGIIFLVKYSIEEVLLGPGPRVLLGALFSVLLLAAGEWLRRSDREFDLPVYAKADVPGILTGAGVIGGFATLYAAHALYGFIGPGLAFVAMTIIGIAALLLSSVHGPKLAAIGILGAYATPLLVSSSEPNPIALTIHVLIVTAVVTAVAHIRDWLWLAIAGIVASCGWIVLAGLISGPAAGIAGLALLVGTAVIFASLFYLREPEDISDRKPEWVALLAFGLLTFSFAVQLVANSALPVTIASLALSAVICGLAAYRTSTAPIAICSAIATLLALSATALPFDIAEGLVQTPDLAKGLVPPDIAQFVMTSLILTVPVALLLLWGTRRAALDAPVSAAWLASALNVIAFLGLVIAYLRIAPFETKPLIGAIALVTAAPTGSCGRILHSPGSRRQQAPGSCCLCCRGHFQHLLCHLRFARNRLVPARLRIDGSGHRCSLSQASGFHPALAGPCCRWHLRINALCEHAV